MVKTHILLLLGLMVLTWVPPAWSEETKIGVIEPQRILEMTKEGKKIKASLEDYVKTRQRLIESEEGDLKKFQEDLAQQGTVLSPAALQAKEEAFRQKAVAYQRHIQELENDIQTKKREVLGEFSKKLEQVVIAIADKEGIGLVLDKGESGPGTMVLYNHPSINLTDRVIKMLDSKPGP
jgi:outer membrane protein